METTRSHFYLLILAICSCVLINESSAVATKPSALKSNLITSRQVCDVMSAYEPPSDVHGPSSRSGKNSVNSGSDLIASNPVMLRKFISDMKHAEKMFLQQRHNDLSKREQRMYRRFRQVLSRWHEKGGTEVAFNKRSNQKSACALVGRSQTQSVGYCADLRQLVRNVNANEGPHDEHIALIQNEREDVFVDLFGGSDTEAEKRCLDSNLNAYCLSFCCHSENMGHPLCADCVG